MNRGSFSLLIAILKKSESQPADSALRTVLKTADIPPEERREIAESVHAYFRWHGWLNRARGIRHQVEEAIELQEQFDRKPQSIAAFELLAKAVPQWIHEAMTVTPELLREWQHRPRIWLRARPGSAKSVGQALRDCSVHAIISDALWYEGQKDLYRTAEFQKGLFEIQDLSSQVVGQLCGPFGGETWWDACAGEGGKTLHLCDLMQNRGLVWVSDPAVWRLEILKKRAARARLFNYRVKVWNKSQKIPIKTKFDGVLVDAPCSGIGTWGRNPQARWTTTKKDVTELAQMQREILGKVGGSIKPGGKLIYSVCTLAREETSEITEWFSDAHPDFRRLEVANPFSPPRKQSSFDLLPQD